MSNSYNVRYVNSSGALNNNNAYNGNIGLRPLRWKVRLSKPEGVAFRTKTEPHHQRKVHPFPAIHSGDKYRIADAAALRGKAKATNGKEFFYYD